MNQTTSTCCAETSRTAAACLGWQVAGILAGAILLGVIYNQFSPLGVRTPQPRTDKPVATASLLKPPGDSVPASKPASISAPPTQASAALPVQSGIPGLTWVQVKSLLEAGKIILIDARPKPTYDAGHIPGAFSLPATSSVPEMQAFAAQFPNEMGLVVYCSSDLCGISKQVAETLINAAGRTDVKVMPGGYTEYQVASKSN